MRTITVYVELGEDQFFRERPDVRQALLRSMGRNCYFFRVDDAPEWDSEPPCPAPFRIQRDPTLQRNQLKN